MKKSSRKSSPSPALTHRLGLDSPITRRDFLNGALLGAGAMLMDFSSPLSLAAAEKDYDGYGGRGDYVGANGNTQKIISEAHSLRGNGPALQTAIDTGETYDMVIIGGGLSGLGAAYHFLKAGRPYQKCLVLEHQRVPGGHAKANEFIVDGERLIAPQASNSFVVIEDEAASGYGLFEEIGIPRSFRYQRYSHPEEGLYFDRTNYGFMLWYDGSPSYGYNFGDGWVKDIWAGEMEKLPAAESVRRDFRTWRYGKRRYHPSADFEAWLDSMTYKDYVEKVMGLSPEITRFVDPVLACAAGLGSDSISAFGAYQVAMPGFQSFRRGFTRRAVFEENKWHSFPGGNEGFNRHLIKALVPGAVRGATSFEAIMNLPFDLSVIDLPENRVRIRLNSLAVSVSHRRDPDGSEYVSVLYSRGGRVFSVRARGVVMACSGLVSRRIVSDLPEEHRNAYAGFHYSPIMVANVAVNNWRFLQRLGITACRWFGGFGFSCNIRRPMIVGDYQPPLDPARPAVITFYVPFYYPGLPAGEQGARGRRELLSTSYADYEFRIRSQMTRLFGKAGFDPAREIAGIILNRWGHAFINPQPGFYFGRNGSPSPRTVIRRRFGRIAFAHSELNGHQHWLGAIEEGGRAAKQVLSVISS